MYRSRKMGNNRKNRESHCRPLTLRPFCRSLGNFYDIVTKIRSDIRISQDQSALRIDDQLGLAKSSKAFAGTISFFTVFCIFIIIWYNFFRIIESFYIYFWLSFLAGGFMCVQGAAPLVWSEQVLKRSISRLWFLKMDNQIWMVEGVYIDIEVKA